MKESEFLAAVKAQDIKNITAIIQTAILEKTLTEEMIHQALLLTAKLGLLKALCCLLQFDIAKAVVIKVHPEYGNQVIYRAVQYGHLPIVRHLLQNFDAISTIVADNDNRLLMRTIHSKYPLVTEYLLTFQAVLDHIAIQATKEQRHPALEAAIAKNFPSITHQIVKVYQKLNLTLPSSQLVQIGVYTEQLRALQQEIDVGLTPTLPPLAINVINHYALPKYSPMSPSTANESLKRK